MGGSQTERANRGGRRKHVKRTYTETVDIRVRGILDLDGSGEEDVDDFVTQGDGPWTARDERRSSNNAEFHHPVMTKRRRLSLQLESDELVNL